MNQIQYLHHYTTIATLALILKNRTLRLNRLDRVDDVAESQKYGEYNLARYLFVSCWTDSEEENIPLWTMYSKGMTGVRISLPIDPFDYRPLQPHPKWGGIFEGQVLSPLPIEMIFGEDFMVNPTWFNKKNFIIRVEYLNDNELQIMRENAVKLSANAQGQPMYQIEGPQKLAGYKSLDWAFQRKVRYIIMAYPTPRMPPTGPGNETWIKELPNHILTSIRGGIGPSFDYFDINLSQAAIDNIKVLLGPLATEGERIVVDALLKQFTQNGQWKQSRLVIRAAGN